LCRYCPAGIKVVKQEVITIVRKYDANGDGRISIEEFFDVFNFKFEN
jgi:Ca2+-binding EF-hand superfamily protein